MRLMGPSLVFGAVLVMSVLVGTVYVLTNASLIIVGSGILLLAIALICVVRWSLDNTPPF